MSRSLVEVREQFSKFMNDPSHLNAASRKIATDFLKSHRSKISPDTLDEVTITGLVHMMGGLRMRRPPVVTSDLFAAFDVERIVVVRVAEEGKGTIEKNKGVGSLTLAEAEEYLTRHTRERETNTKRIREWRRLIARVKPFMTIDSGMTIEQALKAAAAADEKKKKRGA